MPSRSRSLVLIGIVSASIAARACTEDGPPEAKRVTVEGERVWLIQDPPWVIAHGQAVVG